MGLYDSRRPRRENNWGDAGGSVSDFDSLLHVRLSEITQGGVVMRD